MFTEALAAGVVGAAVLWLVLQPLLAPAVARVAVFDPPDAEETPRGRALIALREIDFDKATGKLSDADYEELRTRYSAIALAAMEEEAGAPENDPVITPDLVEVGASTALRRCASHGERPSGELRFCSVCGAGLKTATDECTGCSAAIPSGAAFCPGCGTRVG